MSSKARRRQKKSSADPREIESRTGVAPAPGTVVSRKARDLIAENRKDARDKSVQALAALEREDYAGAGKFFKEASASANLANAHKMRRNGS